MEDLLSSWISIRFAPSYIVSNNNIMENDKRRVLIGFRLKGEPQVLEKTDTADVIDLRILASNVANEENQKAFVVLKTAAVVSPTTTSKEIRFRWVRRS